MKKMRLSLIAASVASLLLSSTTFAMANYKGEAPCPMPPMLKDGWYLGAQLGYDMYSARITNDIVSTSNSFNGWVGGLLGGYGMYFNNDWYLGGELFVNQSAAQSSSTYTDSTGTTYTVKPEANTSWGVGILPGYRLNNATLLYVRLGYNQANFRVKETTTAVGTTTKSRWQGGFNYGLGMETLVMGNWSVRGEYTRTNYSSFRTNFSTLNTKVSPSDNQFMFALIYHFA